MLYLAGSDHDEALPQTPAARSKAQAATPWTGQKVPLKGGTHLRDFTPKENKTQTKLPTWQAEVQSVPILGPHRWGSAASLPCGATPRRRSPEGGGACQVALAGPQT